MNEITVSDLTLEEKVRLLNGVGSWNTYDCSGKLPVLTLSDGPHGLRKQSQENYQDINESEIATCFPTASCSACSWDRDTLRMIADAIADEAIEKGVDIVLGPGINLKRSPLCGRNFEYFSEDPYLAGELGTAFVQALERRGIGTSLKHYAANNQEACRMTSNSIIDERALFELYLSAFEAVVRNGKPSTIMHSYNLINGTHASANRMLLTETLRERWGFEGVVMSDWGAAIDIAESVRAGMDLEMPDSYGIHTSELLEAVKTGVLSEAELDIAVGRILELVYKLSGQDKTLPADAASTHHDIAVRSAQNSAVLLKHAGAFPIRPEERILLVGDLAASPRFQGAGSSHINAAPFPSIPDALRTYGIQADWLQGYDRNSEHANTELESEVLRHISEYDKVLVFCGLTELSESEGFDRKSMKLPENQLALISKMHASRADLSFVCFGGSPFEMPFYDQAEDVLLMYLAGEGVSEACAALLTGTAVPSGKLAESWPLSIRDIPCQNHFGTADGSNVFYTESIFAGYRYYESFGLPVQFPFGYGLSYTTFEYSDMLVEAAGSDCVSVSWTVKNTGRVAGSETAQVYVQNPDQGFMRPAIELRGFEKRLLQPGEETRMQVLLNARSFSIYDITAHDFAVIPGRYRIAVGASIRDLRLHADWDVQNGSATTPISSYEPDFSIEQFAALFPDGKLPVIPEPHKGTYSLFDSMETVAQASFFGRLLFGALMTALPFTVKGGKKNSSYQMVDSCLRETPLYALPALSHNLIRPGLARKLVHWANR